MKSIFEKVIGRIASLFKKEEVAKRVTTRPGWCGSRFNSIDDLMKALIYEPEYKQFFE